MDAYTTPLNKLCAFFERSRDKWKQRSAKNQKRVRSLQGKVRDLERSRESWKSRALAAEAELGENSHRAPATPAAVADPESSSSF